MDAAPSAVTTAPDRPPSADPTPAPADWMRALPVGIGLAALYVPTFTRLAETIWKTEDQGHGPLILAAAIWLMWSEYKTMLAAASRPAGVVAWLLLIFGFVVYAFGRTQGVVLMEVGALIPLLVASIALLYGWSSVKRWRFPIAFLVFLMPLPGFVIDAMTGPLKLWVSVLGESVLRLLDYPVGRSGVTLVVGQYQLLVADACSGLNSMVSLTAVGLFYVYLMGRKNIAHNLLLIGAIPLVAFTANIVRVVIICLVTYHMGDEAGQGFIHGAAGIVLFAVSLTLMFTLDAVLGSVFRNRQTGGAR